MAEKGQNLAVGAERLTEDYSCGYCLQRLIFMTDPRVLPCSHVFCLPCLKDDFTNHGALQCGVCQRTHNIEDLSALPRVKTQMSEREGSSALETILCVVCKDNSTKADSFCTDCESKFCQHHTKIHEDHLREFSGIQHLIIPIDLYESAPDVYRKERCAEHGNNELLLACSQCHNSFCVQCETNSRCGVPKDESITHTVLSLTTLAKEHKEEFKGGLRTLFEKIAELRKLEKNTWQQLDGIQQEVENMIRSVNEFTEKKISEIRRESDPQLKTEIQEYFSKTTNIVEVFTLDLRAKTEKMETLWKSTQKLIHNSHNTEVVIRYNKEMGQVKDANKTETVACSLRYKIVVTVAGERLITQRLVDVSSSIEYQGRHGDSNKKYYSVKVRQDDKVLCGTDDGVEMRSANGLELQAASESVQLYLDAMACSDNIIALQLTMGRGCDINLLDGRSMKSIKVLKSVESQEDSPSRILVSANNVYFINQDTSELKHFSLLSDDANMETVSLDVNVDGLLALCTLPDGGILVGDTRNDTVSKYQPVSPTKFNQVWVCAGIDVPSGIACDPNSHLIYVAGWISGVITVLSPDGVILRKMTCKELKEIKFFFDLTVFGDQLIAACEASGLQRYDITY